MFKVLDLRLLAVCALWVGACHAQSNEAAREQMIERQIIARGISDPVVIDALRKVPRHEFVPKALAPSAYSDHPLPIGIGQTISQPYIVALMTDLLEVEPGQKVLEIGTGSGYQAAILREITPHVFTIEIVEALYQRTKALLLKRGFEPDQVILGDGYKGLPNEAPFDRIIVTAAPPELPPALVEQLAPGGRMVIPVGDTGGIQQLQVITKNADGTVSTEDTIPVRFVPMVRGDGEAE